MEPLSPGAAEIIARRYALETCREAAQMIIIGESPELGALLPPKTIEEQAQI
jgi:hypothetical protein